MLPEVDEVVQVYREYSKFPTIKSARVSNKETAGHVRVYSEWTLRDLERQEKVKFSRNHVAQLDVIFPTPPTDISSEVLNHESPSGRYRAILRKVKDKKEEEKQFIEIWNESNKIKNIAVEDVEQHGKIYEDAQFGCFEWSHSETHLLYVAEKKRPKAKSYFDKKPASAQSKDKEDPVRGDEFVFTEDWGEQLVGKVCPVLCVLDIEQGAASILDNLPENISAGQAVWCKDDAGVVCVGWWHTPYRLGLTYCPMRRSAIFYINLKTSKCTILGSDERAVRSPCFNPDFTKLIWLENSAGGPHMQCSKLIMCDWSTKGIVPVVDVVRKAPVYKFQGLYCPSLVRRCWANDNRRLLVTTAWRSAVVTLVIDTETGLVTKLGCESFVGSLQLKDISSDLVVATSSSPNQPNALLIGHLPAAGKEDSIKWTALDEGPPEFLDLTWRVFSVDPPLDQVNPKYGPMDYECILLEPTHQDITRKPPLIVFPHGGPHAVFSTDFMLYFAGFSKCGFTILAVNYRGSVGFGQDSIDSLLGNIGSQDVKDVQNAVNVVLEMDIVDKEKIVVIGGSHGGFLTTHLIGQYPDTYKAACCRNPVINVATMFGTSDIPDWCFTEAGLVFDHRQPGHAAAYEELWKCSPIRYADQMKTPVLIMIGAEDVRVPTKQGHELRKALQARGVPVRTLVYPGNAHPIDKVDSEADAFVNIVQWFVQHLQ